MDSVPGLGRSPGEGNGNRLQYSCLGNPMDRGAWRAAVHGIAKSWTQLSNWTELIWNAYNRINIVEGIALCVCVCVCGLYVLSHSAISNSLWPHGIFQAKILEWVAISYSRASSQPRDWTRLFCLAGGFFTTKPPGKPANGTLLQYLLMKKKGHLSGPVLFKPVLSDGQHILLYGRWLTIPS